MVILCNIPLDITVDQLIRWKDLVAGGSSLAQVWERHSGVMPLNPAYLSEKYPDHFPSIAGAKYALRGSQVIKCEIPNIYSIRENALLAAYTYRISGQKGRPSTCLSEFGERATIVELEELLGEDVTILERVALLERFGELPEATSETLTPEVGDRRETDSTPVDGVGAPL